MKLQALALLLFTSLLFSSIIIPFSADEIKQSGNHFTGFKRVSPDDSLASNLKTDIWVWHDKENLYALCEAQIDSTFEEGGFTVKDQMCDGDFIRMQLITDISNYYSYTYYFFPLENNYDAIRNSNMYQDSKWNSSYHYKSTINKKKWSSIAVIPFSDMRFGENPPYNWKILFHRYCKAEDEYYSTPFVTTDMKKDYFRKATDIVIKEDIKANKNYTFTPYFLKNYNALTEKTSFDPENVGFDLSYKPNSSTKIKLSMKPDFSDTPMDNAIDVSNSKYAPWLPENRYFFTEDIDAFGVGSESFYSRHILKPIYALKVTANTDKFTYGILTLKDKIENDKNGNPINTDDYFNILAIKPKLEKLDCQFTLLNRSNSNYSSDLLVIKPNFDINKDNSIWSNIKLSNKYSNGDTKKGYSIFSGYNFRYLDFGMGINYGTLSEDFRADMGRVFDTGFCSGNLNIWYNSNPNGAFFKDYGISAWTHRADYDDYKLMMEQNGGGNFWFNTQFHTNTWINYKLGKNRDEDYSKYYKWQSFAIGTSWYKFDAFAANISFSNSNNYVYSLAAVYRKTNIEVGVWGKIFQRINYSLNLNYKHYFDFPKDSEIDDKYYIGNMDLTINFSNKLSLTGGLRYNSDKSYSSDESLGSYSNAKWEFQDNKFIYLGYKSSLYKEEGTFEKDSETMYAKFMMTI